MDCLLPTPDVSLLTPVPRSLSAHATSLLLPTRDQVTTLYIAEDHLTLAELLREFLNSRSDYRVIGHAADGRTALAECLRLVPRVAIIDIDLPRLNGLDLGRALLDTHPSVQILIFTSHLDGEHVRRALEIGARGIVEKPAPLSVLVEAIDAIAAGTAYFGPAVTQILQKAFTDTSIQGTEQRLTSREREVLQLVAEGASNKEVAQQLAISLKTAENHRHNLMRKLSARNAADLTREAFRLGLLRSAPAGSADRPSSP